MEFDLEKFREAIMKSHLLISITRSNIPEAQKILEQMVEHSTAIMDLLDKLEGEKQE